MRTPTSTRLPLFPAPCSLHPASHTTMSLAWRAVSLSPGDGCCSSSRKHEVTTCTANRASRLRTTHRHRPSNLMQGDPIPHRGARGRGRRLRTPPRPAPRLLLQPGLWQLRLVAAPGVHQAGRPANQGNRQTVPRRAGFAPQPWKWPPRSNSGCDAPARQRKPKGGGGTMKFGVMVGGAPTQDLLC
jgi:hypothetical protein